MNHTVFCLFKSKYSPSYCNLRRPTLLHAALKIQKFLLQLFTVKVGLFYVTLHLSLILFSDHQIIKYITCIRGIKNFKVTFHTKTVFHHEKRSQSTVWIYYDDTASRCSRIALTFFRGPVREIKKKSITAPEKLPSTLRSFLPIHIIQLVHDEEHLAERYV